MKKSFILFVFLLCSIVVVAQKKSITGIITDTAGEAVIGASIVEVGTTNGTVSDVDGNFTLSVSDNASIQVSFIGFSSQTLSVQGKMNFKIILKEDSELLQEVVVTGYGGKVSRAKLTNSISTVSPQILEKGIYTNPSQALSGSVPGLKVSLTSGNPTSSPKVILRGGTEFDGSGGPLVIVDHHTEALDRMGRGTVRPARANGLIGVPDALAQDACTRLAVEQIGAAHFAVDSKV